MNLLNIIFTNIYTLKDGEPYFRSKEFLFRVKYLSIRKNKLMSLNFFEEYNGKSIADGFFNRDTKLFKYIE